MKIFELLATWSAISLVVLAVAFIATRLARRTAALRHLIWVCAFVALMLIPAACHFVPGRIIHVPVAEVAQIDAAQVDSMLAIESTPEPVPFNWQPIQATSVVLWMIGATALGLFITRGVLMASAMKRASHLQQPEDLGLAEASEKSGVRRAWELRVSFTRRPPAAMTWGWIKPVVMLPKDSNGWSPEKCETVLLHELAHVRRHDSLTQFVALAVCALYWFNPLVWLAAKAMRLEAEKAADDRVILAGVRPTDYAAELLRIASEFGAGLPRQPLTHIGVSIMKQPKIESRIRSIVDPTNRHRGVARLEVFSVASVALAAVLALVALRPGAAMAQSQALETRNEAMLEQTYNTPALIEVQTEPAQVKAKITKKKSAKSKAKSSRNWTRVKKNGQYLYQVVTTSKYGKQSVHEMPALGDQVILELSEAQVNGIELERKKLGEERALFEIAKIDRTQNQIEVQGRLAELKAVDAKIAQERQVLAVVELKRAKQAKMTAEQRKEFERAKGKMSADQKRKVEAELRLIEMRKSNLNLQSKEKMALIEKRRATQDIERQKEMILIERNAKLRADTKAKEEGNPQSKEAQARLEVIKSQEAKVKAEQDRANSQNKADQDRKKADEERAKQKGGVDHAALTFRTTSEASVQGTVKPLMTVVSTTRFTPVSTLNVRIAGSALTATQPASVLRVQTLNGIRFTTANLRLTPKRSSSLTKVKTSKISKPITLRFVTPTKVTPPTEKKK